MKSVKRALWLLNHSTLRQFEIPILEDLGYEVYLPKKFPHDEGNLSASVDWSFDAKLSIPQGELDILNENNFYEEIPLKVRQIINEHFDIAFFGFFPKQLQLMVSHFKGTLIMRPFGLNNGASYTEITLNTLGYPFMQRLEKIRNRFWFGQAYDNLADVEYGIYKKNSITLPIGLKNAVVNDSWDGKEKKIFFVCPRINTSSYFNRIYHDFQQNFGSFPHLIGGAQPVDVKDKNVTGFVSRQEFEEYLNHMKVMFYHSQEKRHLHYHPLEAIKHGMPLVFMAGGLLDELGGITLPGRSKTIKEAKRKIKRVLNGDSSFTQHIKKSQGILLEKLGYNYCSDIWRKSFQQIESKLSINYENFVNIPKKKIAVFLPIPYRGGTLDTIKMYAKMLKKGAKENGQEVEIVFAHIKSSVYNDTEFDDLIDMGISVREFSWTSLTGTDLTNLQQLLGYRLHMPEMKYSLPHDGINNFLDCDFWFIVSDRIDNPLLPIRPYCLLVTDYIQRYIPELFGEFYEDPFIQTTRNAAVVLANTPHTFEDCVQYAGVPRAKVRLAPLVAEVEEYEEIQMDIDFEDFFIWTTNASFHKNHLRTLKAISRYLEDNGQLICVVTGVDTHHFDINREVNDDEKKDNKYINKVRELIRNNPLLKNKVFFLGELSKARYLSVLKKAKFLIHTVLIDNGTFCAIEAANVGTPTLSSDYPAMCYLSERYKLNCQFFDPYNENQLFEKLLFMEKNYSYFTSQLPSQEVLKNYGWENQASNLWGILEQFV